LYLFGSSEYTFRLEHKHPDGSFGELRPRTEPLDAAGRDPDRQWSEGKLYTCKTCEAEVRIVEARVVDDIEPQSEIGSGT
jgi:hypothetical protein